MHSEVEHIFSAKETLGSVGTTVDVLGTGERTEPLPHSGSTPIITMQPPQVPPHSTIGLSGSAGSGAAATARRGAWARFPGKLDAETDRVSRIMLGLQTKAAKHRK